jgi:predicted AAA+ superfamily ATPase
LYKDIFVFESIKNPVDFENLLKILAMQIGSVVSVNELSQTLGISRSKVDKYLRLLEQSFVIKRINSFSRSSRTEIKKGFKIFFLDVGIRNAILGDISLVSTRSDKGGVFENFVFTELLKKSVKEVFSPKISFWRTRTGLEIDFILERGLEIEAYECKWQEENVPFKIFLKNYPEAKTSVINFNNLFNF